MTTSSLAPYCLKYILKFNSEIPELKITDIRKTNKKYEYFNCFTLQITYCLQKIHWEVNFNLDHPERFPNIICSNEEGDEKGKFSPNISNMKSFKEFKYKSVESFSNCMKELLREYEKYQLMKMKKKVKDKKIKFEFETIKDKKGVKCYVSEDEKRVAFKIPIRFKGLDEFVKFYLKMDGDGEVNEERKRRILKENDFISLIVVYDRARVVRTEIELSHLIEKPHYIQNMTMPYWRKGESYLVEYLNTVQKSLKDAIDDNFVKLNSRKKFILKLNEVLKSPLEYDYIDFFKATYLIELQSFRFFLFITLPDGFPLVKPTVQLQSVQYIQKPEKDSTNDGSIDQTLKDDPRVKNVSTVFPVLCRLPNYDYESDNKLEDNIKSILNRVVEVSVEFSSICEKFK